MNTTKMKSFSQLMGGVGKTEKKGAQEMAAAIAKGRNDPVFFGEYFLGLRFHPTQCIWLWLTTKTQIIRAVTLANALKIPLPGDLSELLACDFSKNILCPSNRFGKTFVTSVKHVWYNFYKIGAKGSPEQVRDLRYVTLNISPHSLQVDAAYRYIVDIFQDKCIFTWNGVRMRNNCRIKSFLVDHKQTRREVIFENNASIKGVPTGEDQASSLAGTQFFYISYDEAPQSLHLREELPAKIQSRLIDSGGPLDIIGTPEVDKPSHAYYQRIAKLGLELKDGFFTLTGRLSDNIFIGEEEKAKTLLAIKQTDPAKYRQVAFGEFITTGSKMFDTVTIERLWWKDADGMLPVGISGHKYIIGIDWGFSDTGDPTVVYVIDYTEMYKDKKCNEAGKVYYEVVYSERIKGGSPYEALARVRILQEDFQDALVIHDSSSMGGVIIKKMLRELGIRHLYDFTVSRNPKDEMLFILARCLSFGRKRMVNDDGKVIDAEPNFGKIRSYYIPELEEQLGNYKIDDNKIEQDEVMSFGMAIWYLETKVATHQTKIWDVNMLANKPELILRVPDAKVIKSQEVTINERLI